MTLSEYLTAHGRAVQLAGAVGVTPATVSNWNSGKHPVPAELGADIERATGGQVTRQELFPDTWARIWPELGAPSSDFHVTRRAQLRMLIDQRAAGNIAAFADQFGYSRSRVSQFLSDTYNEGRSIGERAARALEEVVCVPFGWLDQPADRLLKIEETPTIDHAAELRGAIAQTRLVFEGHRDAQDALEYLEQVLKAGQRAEAPAHACAPTPSDSRGVDVMLDTPACKSAPPRDNSALAQIKRELFTTADQLQQPVDLTVQLMLLAELRMLKDYARVAEASSQSCIRHS